MRGAVVLSIFDWWYHSHGHSDIQLARALAHRMPVLFANSIGMRFPRPGTATAPFRRIERKLRSSLRALQFPDSGLNLAVGTPLSLPKYSGMLSRLNAAFVELQIRRWLKHLGIAKPMVIVTVPTYGPVALGLGASCVFYYRSDLHSAFPGTNRQELRQHEQALLSNADIVLYAGEGLYREERDQVAAEPILIGHGVDSALFAPTGPIAQEVDELPRPRVGFFGELRARSVDFELIAAVAGLCPDIHFVLGGEQLDDLGQHTRLANVHVLPSCPHHEMPGRWRGLDAAILPYRHNAWLRAIEPIKLNEIFATGLPAVGTALPALLQRAAWVEIAEGPDAFAISIREVARESQRGGIALRQSRRSAMSFRSWETIAAEVDHLSKLVEGGHARPRDLRPPSLSS